MKQIIFMASITLMTVIACSKTPQEKAIQQAENAAEKAGEAQENAIDHSDAADINQVKAFIYADMASANAAVAKVPMPALKSDESKSLAKDYANAVIKRINAKSDNEVQSAEEDIIKAKNNVEEKYQKSKITVEDRDAILAYGTTIINDAKKAAGVQ